MDPEPEEEPRRIGATSRANSVRFDESANQGHWSHASRSSMDLIRSAGGIPMSERTSSHKSEGRASSVHSMRSAASGRANSLNIDTGFSFDSGRSPLDDPGLAPGLLLLGSVPAIIRCWLNMDFKHNALLYAAVCTGSYRSFVDRRLLEKLGFTNRIVTSPSGFPTVALTVYLPEAIPHPASSRSGSPAPQLPTVTVTFTVLDAELLDSKGIQVIIGSDALRIHNADVLFSTNRMTLFDDDRNKLSIPLVRPEDENTFSGLGTINRPSAPARSHVNDGEVLGGLGQQSSMQSLTSGIIGSHRPVSAELDRHMGPSDSSDDEKHARTGRSIRFASVEPSEAASEAMSVTGNGETQQQEPLRASSATWNSWRKTTDQAPAPVLDYASIGKQKEPVQRKESGMKVLRPMRSASRNVSATTMSSPGGGDGKSRFFDDGRKKTSDGAADNVQPDVGTSHGQSSSDQGGKARVNPAGGGSAFSWLKTSGK